MRKLLCIILLIIPLRISADCLCGPAPPLQGFGATTVGGTGQPIYHVTNLSDSGTGSFRDALSASNRYIVFDIAGTLSLGGNYNVTGKSFITIDGTTAPSPGITIDNGGGLFFLGNSHDIIVKSIRVQNSTDDNFSVFESHDIVFDHISSRGAQDGALDITVDSYNVTVQYSILAEETGSGASLIKYNANRTSIHHNIFDTQERNPLASGDDGVTTSSETTADIRNNIVWNWGLADGSQYGEGVGVDHGAKANIINNYFKATGTYPILAALAIELNHNGSGAQAYTSGNISGNGTNLNTYGNVGSAFTAATVTTDTACAGAIRVLSLAGTRPLNAADTSLIASITLTGC